MTDLHARLLEAHASGDIANLIDCYVEAAESASTEEAKAFYLTHAQVFALEAGYKIADALRNRLVAMGRETPL